MYLVREKIFISLMKILHFIEKLRQTYPQNLKNFQIIGGKEGDKHINFFKNLLKIINSILVKI